MQRGYRIPLPPGEYVVHVLLASSGCRGETSPQEGILAEGRALVECESQPVKYIDTAVHSARMRIDDGFLDLDFTPRPGGWNAAAIEIEQD
jgi:hypothetical protein